MLRSRSGKSERLTRWILYGALAVFALVLAAALFVRYFVTDVARQNESFRSQIGVPTQAGRSNAARLLLTETDDRTLTLAGGEVAKIDSLINVQGQMKYGMHVWNEAGAPADAAAWVRVDLATQTLSVFRGGHEIGTGVILYGTDNYPTPLGRFPIKAKMRDHKSSIYDAPMPYTLRLTDDGVSIHGSNVRRGLATHGCIGIPSDFAEMIFSVVDKNTPVYIVNGAATG